MLGTPHLSTVKKIASSAVGLPLSAARTTIGAAVGAAHEAARAVRPGKHEGARPTPSAPREATADQGGPAGTSGAVEPEEPQVDIDPETPVNVVDELGLDPAPVDRSGEPKPVTGIDAAADPDHVDATPADVADIVGETDDTPPPTS